MKIVAGLGSVQDFQLLAEAGVDEVFVGYIPERYMQTYGEKFPLNRREVRFYNVQIGGENELKILARLSEKYDVKVALTLNALSYEREQVEEILGIVRRCKELGIEDFIVADMELIQALITNFGKENIGIHLSGEYGELNHRIVEYMIEQGVRRIIFPRQTSLEEMRQLTGGKNVEFESFALNEQCHFTGAYCNSLHCDEFCHACKIPYRYEGIQVMTSQEEILSQEEISKGRIHGESGCGLCELYALQKSGVTHLKVVSRGQAGEETAEDIRELRRALDILKDCESEKDYQEGMMRSIFSEGCSGNCYYYEQRRKKLVGNFFEKREMSGID